MVRYANDEYINLILDTVDLDENSNPILVLMNVIGKEVMKEFKDFTLTPFTDTKEIEKIDEVC
jgi:hypothetical protein